MDSILNKLDRKAGYYGQVDQKRPTKRGGAPFLPRRSKLMTTPHWPASGARRPSGPSSARSTDAVVPSAPCMTLTRRPGCTRFRGTVSELQPKLIRSLAN